MSQLSPEQFSELACLNQQLQETAASFAALCKGAEAVPLARQSTSDGGEIRTFYLSPKTLQYEQELQREYRVSDFHGLLEETYTRLMGLAKVMLSVTPNSKIKGQVVVGLGSVLDQVSQLVWRMTRLSAKVTREDLPSV